MEIYVGFSKNRKHGWFSNLIAKFLGAKFSHCYILHKGIVYHAAGKNVHTLSYSEFKENNEIFEEIEIKTRKIDRVFILNYLKSKIGVEYSTRNLIGLALDKIFGLKRNPFKNGENGFTCGEYVYMALGFIGFFINKQPDRITPKDIYNNLKLM